MSTATLHRIALSTVRAGLRSGRRHFASDAAGRSSELLVQGTRRLPVLGFGLASASLAASGAFFWQEHVRCQEALALKADTEQEEAEAEKRKAEIDRLASQASYWRLAELFLTMLPVVFAWPLWLVDPGSFWSLVAVRVDCCGPTFVKLAQWLATRRDIFPESVCEAFSSMHEKVQARWSKGICPGTVAESLKETEAALRSIEPKAHASGSIAEVFFGVLEDGTDVAVKCLRPGVVPLLEADLAWLLKFAQFSAQVERLRLLGVQQAVTDFCEHVQMQTDFRIEAGHLRRFRENFANSSEAIRFPTPLYVTQEALVLSRETGQELAQVFKLGSEASSAAASATARSAHAEDRQACSSSTPATSSTSTANSAAEAEAAAYARAEELRRAMGMPPEMPGQIARESMAAYMRMIFKDQFIHGDLHPGNIMLQLNREQAAVVERADGGDEDSAASAAAGSSERQTADGLWGRFRGMLPTSLGGQPSGPGFEIVLLDAGLAIPLPQEKVEALRSLAISIIYANFYRAAEILYDQSPDSSKCLDPIAFKTKLAKVFEDCRRNVWEEGFVQVSDACLDSLNLVQRHNVGLDTTLTWTLFGMLSIEGSAKRLDPQVDCARAATQYIITFPSLMKEMRYQSWATTRHMILELMFSSFGLDYWDLRYRAGLTWQDLHAVAA